MNEQVQGNTPDSQPNDQTLAGQVNTDTLPKESVDSNALKNEIEREKARAATAQQEADRLRKELRSIQTKGSQPMDNVEPNQPVSSTVNERAELERGVFKMILEKPEYKEVLDSDSTLKTFFEKDPLTVTSEPINVDDALYQIKRFFDDKVYERKLTNQPTPPSEELKPIQPGVVSGKNSSSISQQEYDKLDPATQDALFAKSTKEYLGL